MNYRYIPDKLTRALEGVLARNPGAKLSEIRAASPDLARVTYDELNVRISQVLQDLLAGEQRSPARA